MCQSSQMGLTGKADATARMRTVPKVQPPIIVTKSGFFYPARKPIVFKKATDEVNEKTNAYCLVLLNIRNDCS